MFALLIPRLLFARGCLIASSFALACAIQGCAPWPASAEGGLAERETSSSPAIFSARERFEALARAGGLDSSPGRMSEARELLVRAHREHAGGLMADAEVTLFHVSAKLDAIEDFQRRRAAKHRSSRADVE